MDILGYSELQVKLLLETIKVLIPVCTGFLVLFSVFFRMIIEKNFTLKKVDRILLILIYFWAIVAIGLWSGVLSFLVDCSSVFQRFESDKVLLNIPKLNWEWRICGAVAETAHLSFFLSVIFFSVLSYRVLIRKFGQLP